MPHVSVVIPSYNREKYIKRAIESILDQSYQDFEIIIVDDASDDNTDAIVTSLAEKDARIHFIRHNTKRGAQAARNTGIRAAKGDFIAFLDSDDEWLPNRLEHGLRMQGKSDFDVVHSKCYQTIGDDNSLQEYDIPPLSGDVYKELLKAPGPVFPALLVRRNCLEQIGYLDEEILSYQEWDTSIRLAKHNKFGFIPEPLFIYHCHNDEAISKDMKREADGWGQIVEKHKKEIVRVAGKKALKNHYEQLVCKYLSINEFRIAGTYFYKLFCLSKNYNEKFAYFLRMILSYCKIDPKYASRQELLGWINSFVKKKLSFLFKV